MSRRLTSIRKAAVLVASLDDVTAELLLEQMAPGQADEVRRQSLELHNIDPAEQRAVIDEFFRIGPLVPEADPPGLDLEQYLPHRVSFPIDEYLPAESTGLDWNRSERVSSPSNVFAESDSQTPFSFLEQTKPESLVPFLEREHPQAIALVLAHLQPERAGVVLARLPATLQADVVRRLVDLEETDANVVREVEQAVKAWLTKRQPIRRRVAGDAAVSAILNSAQGSARRQILNNLAAHDRSLAHRFTPPQPLPHRFTFKQLCRLPGQAILAAVQSSARHTAVLALAGLPEEFVEELLAKIAPDEADRITNGLVNLNSIRLADIDRAQEELAELANHLHAEGRLPGVDVSHLTAIA